MLDAFGLCSLCDKDGVGQINGCSFCLDHIDDGFRLIMRSLALLHGMDAEKAEDVGVRLLDDVHRRRWPLGE